MFQLFSRRTLKAMSRRKTLLEAQESSDESGTGLRRSLTAIDLILFGVGSSVGAGIFVLVGLGAKLAGPAISLSFLGCGMTCILTSLAYAEFASRIPAAGSAFTYVYVAFGEFYAWIVGFFLILGYGFTASVTARAWGDYTGAFLARIFPGANDFIENLTEFHPFGVSYSCSPLSLVIIGLGTAVLLKGAKDSATFNNIITCANISMLFLVVVAAVASGSVDKENFVPFAPHGLSSIVQGGGLVFFSYIGFDQVASLSEEVVHPERNMPIGITGSLVVSTLIYVAVSLAVVGMASFRYLGETVPIINALLVNACCTHLEQTEALSVDDCLNNCTVFHRPILSTVAHIVSGGAIFGLSASCFTSLMGQPRIFLRMALDGLWFPIFAEVDPDSQVPSAGIKITGVACGLLACFVPLEALANLISLGTLMVFTFVDAGVILLRLRNVAEASYHSIQNPQTKEEEKRLTSMMHQNVVQLLILYFVLILAAAITLRVKSYNNVWVIVLVLAACACGWMISALPSTWIVEHDQQLHGHTTKFDCPWVPLVPLGGVACNTFMMGSLPLSSWLFCGIWLGLGMLVYFTYGIHNSALGKKSLYSDTTPLVPWSAATETDDEGYDSTMNISVRQVSSGRLL